MLDVQLKPMNIQHINK